MHNVVPPLANKHRSNEGIVNFGATEIQIEFYGMGTLFDWQFESWLLITRESNGVGRKSKHTSKGLTYLRT